MIVKDYVDIVANGVFRKIEYIIKMEIEMKMEMEMKYIIEMEYIIIKVMLK